jgi:hypothetical protein
MRRREFIAGLGSAAAWPVAARAQQAERVRRIGVLSGVAESDIESQIWDAAFRKRLGELGWIDGRNIHIDYRWGAGSVDRMLLFAKELVRLEPDVCVTVTGDSSTAAGDRHRSYRVCDRVRSSRQWVCEEPRKSGRQHYRLYQSRGLVERPMARTAT